MEQQYPRIEVLGDGPDATLQIEFSPGEDRKQWKLSKLQRICRLPLCLIDNATKTPNALTQEERKEVWRLVNWAFRLRHLYVLASSHARWQLENQIVDVVLSKINLVGSIEYQKSLRFENLEKLIDGTMTKAMAIILNAFRVEGFVVQNPELDDIISKYLGFSAWDSPSLFTTQGQGLRELYLSRFRPEVPDDQKVALSTNLNLSRWIKTEPTTRGDIPSSIRLAATMHEAMTAAECCDRFGAPGTVVDLDVSSYESRLAQSGHQVAFHLCLRFSDAVTRRMVAYAQQKDQHLARHNVNQATPTEEQMRRAQGRLTVLEIESKIYNKHKMVRASARARQVAGTVNRVVPTAGTIHGVGAATAQQLVGQHHHVQPVLARTRHPLPVYYGGSAIQAQANRVPPPLVQGHTRVEGVSTGQHRNTVLPAARNSSQVIVVDDDDDGGTGPAASIDQSGEAASTGPVGRANARGGANQAEEATVNQQEQVEASGTAVANATNEDLNDEELRQPNRGLKRRHSQSASERGED
ncbi:uncharacterized protein AB675_10975 [Cyphellophora attinorum]|uniref:Uncharacterized protein n=1 Tax=Cyphellophora attinorum TaxID=1664694 RepID=A0A0N0NI70_9EURO|nr:uncharacterized protein AB675_10975 [Phialophora attinorum]KPI35501.1 hypothetical protein AB675_10975 [Phialophora attinorum]